MPTSLIIPVIAILATPQVTEGIKEKVLEGGKHAEHAMELCMKDKRDMSETFYLEVTDSTQGVYKLFCQTLETTTGPFYAVKGEFRSTPALNAFINLFEEKGIRIIESEDTNTEKGE